MIIMRRDVLLFGLVAFLVPTLTVAAVASPAIAVGGIAAAAIVLASLRWWYIPVVLLAIACFQTLPAFIPTQFATGPLTVFLYEPILLIAALRVSPLVREARHWVAFLGASAALLAWFGVSLVAGRDFQTALSEVRPLISVVLATFIAFAVYGRLKVSVLRTLTLLVLWSSAALMLASIAFGIPISGRAEDASLYLSTGGVLEQGGTRLITGSTTAATVVVMVLIGLWLGGEVSGRAWTLVVPAGLILFLGLSRNTLIGLAVATLFVLVLLAGRVRLISLALRATVVSIIVWGVVWVSSDVFQIAIIRSQLAAFDSRVLGGITADTLSTDTSVIYREVETQNLLRAFASSPVVGHGLGYEYQPGSGEANSFWATKGRSYAHNFWLWMLVKGGLIALIAFVLTLAAAIGRHLRHRVTGPIAISGALLGLMAISFVAPQPLGTSSAVAVGALLGALFAIPPSKAAL